MYFLYRFIKGLCARKNKKAQSRAAGLGKDSLWGVSTMNHGARVNYFQLNVKVFFIKRGK
jgi:hypothetical protein